MQRKKPSEEMSIVPESIRDMMGNRVSKEDRAALSAMAEEARPRMRSESTQMARAEREFRDAYKESGPSWNPIKNISDLVTGRTMERAEDLGRARYNLNKTEDQTGGYAKGGMVKKYANGGLVKVRGYGKARSKPCKIC